MSTSTPAIETVGLGRDDGSTRALDALDLIVGPGMRVGLLGPNGAGKTTALLRRTMRSLHRPKAIPSALALILP